MILAVISWAAGRFSNLIRLFCTKLAHCPQKPSYHLFNLPIRIHKIKIFDLREAIVCGIIIASIHDAIAAIHSEPRYWCCHLQPESTGDPSLSGRTCMLHYIQDLCRFDLPNVILHNTAHYMQLESLPICRYLRRIFHGMFFCRQCFSLYHHRSFSHSCI